MRSRHGCDSARAVGVYAVRAVTMLETEIPAGGLPVDPVFRVLLHGAPVRIDHAVPLCRIVFRREDRMMQESQDRSELVGALLAAEYADAGIDVDAMRAVRAGEHGEWLAALEATGL